jgi:hypothetical protein
MYNGQDSNSNAALLRSSTDGKVHEQHLAEGIVPTKTEEQQKIEIVPKSHGERKDQNMDHADGDAQDRWELCRIIPQEEEIECGHKACTNTAIKIWISVVTKTEFPFCTDCEKANFGDVEKEEIHNTDQDCTKQDVDACSTPKDRNQADGRLLKTMIDSCATQGNGEDEDDSVDSIPRKEDPEEAEEEGETFALVDFVPLEKLKAGGRACDICIQNDQENKSSIQPMPACTIWQSTQDPNSKKWYYCIDCLVDDYGSFPDYEELRQHNALQNINPATYHEHLELMKTKCSRKRNPNLPMLPSSFFTTFSSGLKRLQKSRPSPDNEKSSRSVPDNETATIVTPPPKSFQSITLASETSLHTSDVSSWSVIPVKVTPKALAVHKKWQELAEAMGGKGAKIIVSAEKAKKIIYLAIRDEFRPMNITDIYKVRKHYLAFCSSMVENMI